MGGTKPTFVPYATFEKLTPANGEALTALGRCRINPLTCTESIDEFNSIFYKNVDQSKVDDTAEDAEIKASNKKLKKKYMKQGVAMAQRYIYETLKVDASIVDVEVLIDASMIIESDGCIAACFLDAGCDKIAVSGEEDELLKAMNSARVPKDRLIAHFLSTSQVSNAIVEPLMAFTDSISINHSGSMKEEDYIDLLTRISKSIGPNKKAKDITVNIHVPASATDQDTEFVSMTSKYCSGKETPNGNVFLIDPTPLQLGMSFVSCIHTDRPDGLYTTVVCTRSGVALGLVYSSKESIAAALECGRGVYYSRSRNGLWRKGDTSGHFQTLHMIDVDCDGDAIRFTVTQRGDDCAAFCHLNTLTCWGEPNGIRHLEGTLKTRLQNAPEGSYTKRLFDDPELLRDKLVEEAQELAEEEDKQHVAEELADVLYFAMAKAVKHGVSIDDAVAELDKRTRKVTRRKGDSKAFRIEAAKQILQK